MAIFGRNEVIAGTRHSERVSGVAYVRFDGGVFQVDAVSIRSDEGSAHDIQSPLDSLKNSPGMLDALKNIQLPLDSLKNSPGMLDALKNIQSPLDALKDSPGVLGAFETRRPGDVEEPATSPSSNETINLGEGSSEAAGEERGGAKELPDD
ncbi:MAG TPA: hypothetical protein VGG53_16655 [Mycobacterium sp.]|jgi:hypothetical protein|uniref:hypothetical protein n=1 Tax=Mycobacterium sp. TaxID=1785 RepID=UPI002F4275C8